MFRMVAIICFGTVLNCNVMWEEPPRFFDTKKECLIEAVMKANKTKLTLPADVVHFEVGGEPVEVI